MNTEIIRGVNLYKDGDTWCVLVGSDIQSGKLYYDKTKTVDGAIYEWLKSETSDWDVIAVERFLPSIITTMAERLVELEGELLDTK